jgi:hypothetical protein
MQNGHSCYSSQPCYLTSNRKDQVCIVDLHLPFNDLLLSDDIVVHDEMGKANTDQGRYVFCSYQKTLVSNDSIHAKREQWLR